MVWVGLLTTLAIGACAPAAPQQQAATTVHETTTDVPKKVFKSGTDPDCTKATKVTIDKDGGKYAFTPTKLKIQRGAFLAVTNKSDAKHALQSDPDAGIVKSVLGLDERQVIQFPDEGTFIVQSADADHRAVMQVTVDGESGCDTPKPSTSITDGNAFDPAKLTVAATENFAVVNKSGATVTVTCSPDPGSNKDHSRLEDGESQLLAIDEPGKYTCRSVQHPSAKVTITVKED
jgi:plastocyanin